MEFCRNSTPQDDRCSATAILLNGQKNMFALMGRLTDLATAFQSFPPKDPSQSYDLAYQMGNDIGEMVRLLINFKV